MSKAKLNIAGKINTVPKQLSVNEIEDATKKVHGTTEKSEPKIAAATPSVKAPVEKIMEVKLRKVRLSVDISPQLHKKLKIKAVENDTNVMHYVEKLIQNDLEP